MTTIEAAARMSDGSEHPLRFGWFIPTYGDFDRFMNPEFRAPAGMELFERVARAAERSGFEYALVPVGTPCWEAWIACAMMSARTTTLKMLVAARPGYIVPTQMAKMISTFDQLSGGRLSINLIAGGDPQQLAMDGLMIPHDDRYSVMDESVRIMKAVWSATEPIDWEGRHFQLQGAVVEPKPLQRPWPRFYIGGESSAARDVGARHADCYFFWGDTPQRTAEKIADIRQRAAAEREDPERLTFGMRLQVVVRQTESEAWDAAHDLIAETTEAQRQRRKLIAADSEADTRMWDLAMESEQNDYRIAPHLWSGLSTVRTGAGVCVVGNPQQVADTLSEFVEIGCTEFCLSGYPHDAEAERFGQWVIPLMRDRWGGAAPSELAGAAAAS